MPALRFIAGLLLLVAVIALVTDATGWIAGTGPLRAKSTLQHWTDLSPKSLAALRKLTPQQLWSLAILPVLELPTWGLFAGLAAMTAWLGRRRHRIDVFSN